MGHGINKNPNHHFLFSVQFLLCIFVVPDYKSDFKSRTLILDCLLSLIMRRPRQKSREEEGGFKQLVTDSGLSLKAADELWKWYNPQGKKGVASF